MAVAECRPRQPVQPDHAGSRRVQGRQRCLRTPGGRSPPERDRRCDRGRRGETDLVFRYGGDEFAVSSPEPTLAPRCRSRSGFERQCIEWASRASTAATVDITASIGVATFPEDGTTGADILLAADRACFVAKRGGRDRIADAAKGLFLAAEFSSQEPTPVDRRIRAGRRRWRPPIPSSKALRTQALRTQALRPTPNLDRSRARPAHAPPRARGRSAHPLSTARHRFAGPASPRFAIRRHTCHHARSSGRSGRLRPDCARACADGLWGARAQPNHHPLLGALVGEPRPPRPERLRPARPSVRSRRRPALR